MNTHSQMIDSSSPADPPLKRKRGRPRKEESHVQAETIPAMPTIDNLKKNKQCTETPAVFGNEMVGQVVSGVIEGSFDAGYLLKVKVGDSDTHLRGVVFLPGRFASVTASNDVAPEARMYTRTEMPVPVQSPPVPGLVAPLEQCDKQAMETHNFAPMLEFQGQGLTSELQSQQKQIIESGFGISSSSDMPQMVDDKVAEQNDLLSEFEASLAKVPKADVAGIEQSKPTLPSVPTIDRSPDRTVNLELQIQNQAADNDLEPSQPVEQNQSSTNIKPAVMSVEQLGIGTWMEKPASPAKPAPPELTISGNGTSKLNGKPEILNSNNAETESTPVSITSLPVTLFERELMPSSPNPAADESIPQMIEPQLCNSSDNLFERHDPPSESKLVSDKPEPQPQPQLQFCSSAGAGEGCDSTNRMVGDQMKIV